MGLGNILFEFGLSFVPCCCVLFFSLLSSDKVVKSFLTPEASLAPLAHLAPEANNRRDL